MGTDGGATIQVQGLDANWDLVIQTADLDGTDTTTEVELTTPLLRVFRMKVHAEVVLAADLWVGATGVAAGTAKAIIQAGNNQTLMAIYTVPAGKTAYMTQYYVDNVPTATKIPDSVEFKLWMADSGVSDDNLTLVAGGNLLLVDGVSALLLANQTGYAFQLKHERAIPKQGGGILQPFKPYMRITEKTDIKISASVVGGAGDDGHPHAGFDLILVDNLVTDDTANFVVNLGINVVNLGTQVVNTP